MKQETFVSLHRKEWERLEAWLDAKSPAGEGGLKPEDFPQAYRRVCQQLALARTRAYSPQLLERLQTLVQAGHQRLYRTRRPEWRRVRRFVSHGFPRLVRREWRFILAAALLLYLPMLVMLWLTRHRPQLIYSVYSAADVANYESMYDPAKHAQALGRDSQSDLAMFGFYILHNVSLGFQAMAGGLFAGLGSLLSLGVNGVMLGAAAGYLTAVGFGSTFWGFVAGHSAWELNAIVVCGAAGLKLGFTLLAPGRAGRGAALLAAGDDAALMALGAFLMLVMAAFIEAYWSSIVWLPAAVKYAAAAGMWIVVLTWLGTGGRHADR